MLEIPILLDGIWKMEAWKSYGFGGLSHFPSSIFHF